MSKRSRRLSGADTRASSDPAAGEAKRTRPEERPLRVVIVGAGASGLSCARTLQELAPGVEVVVLEGRARVGGRIDTVTLAGEPLQKTLGQVLIFVADGSSKVDLGASYIHGCNQKNNSVLAIAQELGVELKREYGGYQAGWLDECRWFTDGRLRPQGSVVSRRDVRNAWRMFEAVSEALGKRANVLVSRGSDMSIGEYLRNHMSQRLRDKLSHVSRVGRLVFERLTSTVWGYVGPLDRLSARLMADSYRKDDDEDDEEGESHYQTASSALMGGMEDNLDDTGILSNGDASPLSAMVVGGGEKEEDDGHVDEEEGEELDEDALVVDGYRFLIEYLQVGVDIRLEKTVSAIVRTSQGVSVFTRDGERFDADATVVTVPLGVLQGLSAETKIEFIPPLSEKKQAAIDSLGMGVENKVVMRFLKPFWPLKGSPYMQVTEKGLRFVSLHTYGKPGVLVAHLCPPSSIDMASQSDPEVVAMVTDVLCGMFGEQVVQSAVLEESIVTRWHQDPFCMGAYSYMPVGADFEHIHALNATEGGCILFAGEATSAWDSQCVTGAFETGHQSALRIIEHVFKCRVCPWCQSFFGRRGYGKSKEYCSRKCLEEASPKKQPLFCICKTPADERPYLQCVSCQDWLHLECVGLVEAPIVDYFCDSCERSTKERAP